MSFLIINSRVRIPISDLVFRATRSSGAGGQNVNKVETAVELIFDLQNTPHLSEDERARAMSKLASHLDSDGALHLESQSERSQLRNKDEVTRRFAQRLREALIVPKKRRKTKPTRASIEKRLESKKRAGNAKRERQEKRWKD
jgi:ribosome-associated protein